MALAQHRRQVQLVRSWLTTGEVAEVDVRIAREFALRWRYIARPKTRLYLQQVYYKLTRIELPDLPDAWFAPFYDVLQYYPEPRR